MPEGCSGKPWHCLPSGGSYLAGAVGELPASGLLALYVEDYDAGLAKEMIEDYLKASPILEESARIQED